MQDIGLGLAIFVSLGVILTLCNHWLPTWFCNNMGWHLEPAVKRFDGCSLSGTCPRCGNHVLQDSQGNWF